MLEFGISNAVVCALSRLACLLVSGIYLYAFAAFTASFCLNTRKFPGHFRAILSFLCLASLFGLGNSNTALLCFQRVLDCLVAGIGGYDVWSFEIPPQFRTLTIPGTSSPISDIHQGIDRIGYLRLNSRQKEDYDAHCDFVEGLQTTIRNRDTTISRLNLGIEHRDITISRQQSKLDEQEIELEHWRKHRCPIPTLGQPSVGISLHRIASLETSLDKSRNANAILLERLQQSEAKTEKTSSETQQPSNPPQQARIV